MVYINIVATCKSECMQILDTFMQRRYIQHYNIYGPSESVLGMNVCINLNNPIKLPESRISLKQGNAMVAVGSAFGARSAENIA